MEGSKHKSLKVPKLYGSVKCCQDGSRPLQDFPGFGLQWDENETLGFTSLFPSPEAMASGSPFIATREERERCMFHMDPRQHFTPVSLSRSKREGIETILLVINTKLHCAKVT